MAGETRSASGDGADDQGATGFGSASTAAAPPREAPEIAAGDCFDRYTVLRRIGAGGMGVVYAAHDPKLDRVVALKLMKRDIGGASPESRARFQREAHAMARLNHPNVVSIFDAGAVGEQVFVAMELVEGPTVAAWLAERPRGWREVVAVFLQAGQGLVAAHAAGIVHRDFKPANVIIGERVRVADFGLARAVYDPGPEGPQATTALESVITRTGGALGTPAYMAPELRAGAQASPLSDQYAFGVALHEALFGQRPGEPAPQPRPVPAALRTVAARALAPRPEDRYRSMRDLLVDLARDPARARRRWLAAMGVAVLAAGGLIARQATATPPCGSGAALIAPVWDDAVRARVATAFRATGQARAEERYARVDAALRGRQAAWAQAHREACEATHVRHEQSEALLDKRMRCLTQARNEMAALVSVLGSADADALERAPQAASRAGDTSGCADVAALAETVAPPRDPAVAAEIEAVQEELARLAAMHSLGQWKEGLVAARQLLGRARRLEHQPARARALGAIGRMEINADGDLDAAITDLQESARAGGLGKDDVAVASALTELVGALAAANRPDAAELAFHAARAAVARAGDTPPLLARLFSVRGDALARQGRQVAAAPLRAITWWLFRVAYGPDSIEAAETFAAIPHVLGFLGYTCESLSLHDRAVTLVEAAAGPGKRAVTALRIAGAAYRGCGHFERAAELLERALALSEESYGADSPSTAFPVLSLALVRAEQRRLPEARALAERGVRIRVARSGAESLVTAAAYEHLAAVARLDGHAEEAHRLLERTIQIRQALTGANRYALATACFNDAGALIDLGRLSEARAAAERAREVVTAIFGEDNPNQAYVLTTLGDVVCAERRCAEAVPLYRRALDLMGKQAGIASDSFAEPLTGLCRALVAAGDGPMARVAAARAIAAAARAPVDVLAGAQFCLAEAEWLAPADRPAALERARATRALLAALPYPARDLPRLDSWLASRR